MYQELGEVGNETENSDYQKKKIDDLQKRVADAYASIHHLELVSFLKISWVYFVYIVPLASWKAEDFDYFMQAITAFVYFNLQINKDKIQVQQLHESDTKRSMASMKVNLDIPESIGLTASTPVTSSSRLVDLDTGRRGKRKI